MAGYRLGRYLATEVAYTNLGQTSAETPTDINSQSEVKGLSVAGIAILPLGANFSVNGRLGLYRWDRNANALVSSFGQLSSVVADDDGTDMLVGIGLS